MTEHSVPVLCFIQNNLMKLFNQIISSNNSKDHLIKKTVLQQ